MNGGGGGGGGGNGGGGGGGGGNRRSNVPLRHQTFDSNGPEVRVRGNAFQVYEKYLALARDASSAGDRIAAENYFQHAEHYYRIINANNEGQPYTSPNRDGYDGEPLDGAQNGNGGGNGNGNAQANGHTQDDDNHGTANGTASVESDVHGPSEPETPNS